MGDVSGGMATRKLTDNQLARAAAANPRWKAKLGGDWPGDAQLAAAGIVPLRGVGDFDFAEKIAAFQLARNLGGARGLDVDGICGRDTAASLRGAMLSPLVGRPVLIVGGQEVPAEGCRVITFHDPAGLSFVNMPVYQPRNPAARIDLFVLHFDGCRSSRQCYDVLIHRGLSVHLMLDRDGTIYQALDLKTAKAFHAGEANSRSVGVEICNPELPERNDAGNPRPVGPLEVTNAGAAGARRPVLGYYPAQVQAVIALARAVARAFDLPAQLPAATSTVSAAGVTRGFDPRVAGGQFRGVCGHYHLKNSKVDPGVTLWAPLRDAGFAVG